ncbi:hypothetical protein [Vibrio coralliirubri]|uniref:hypothetical protein n=1 Tax=Vibrio coralliirubri TaxID=1516159 RepID=UPI000630FDB1|nr:hypothetical protein [Vibrio coralliirubri]CDT96930.1 conserved exported hypothetical protein [Vibrio coralliirubri]CDU11638.1 conserved exported hypothetical protein [Vibrio coralliirubri]
MNFKLLSILTLSIVILSGCNSGGSSDNDDSTGPVVPEEDVITQIRIESKYYPDGFEQSLQNNMDYFIDGVGVSTSAHIPFDHVLVNDGEVTPSNYTNISTIALYINVLIQMIEFGDEAAATRLSTVLSTLENAPKWNGLFYWLYQIEGAGLTIDDSAIASAVDNGIMSFTLAGLYGALNNHTDESLNQLSIRAEALLNEQITGWSVLYDSNQGYLRAGWDNNAFAYLPYYLDRKANESRLATLWAVMMTSGQVPNTAYTDMTLVRGQVSNDGLNVTPMLTWDGSYFQAILPALWLDESSLMPSYEMVEEFTQVHLQYADEYNIPLVSASSTIDDGYAAFGLESVSESHRKYSNSIETGTTGTPHALALYYMLSPTDAIQRLNQLKLTYPNIETVAGWVDAIDSSGQVSSKVIGLDQGMFVGAFFADSVRENVATYIDFKGQTSTLQTLYSTFVADEIL